MQFNVIRSTHKIYVYIYILFYCDCNKQIEEKIAECLRDLVRESDEETQTELLNGLAEYLNAEIRSNDDMMRAINAIYNQVFLSLSNCPFKVHVMQEIQ